MKKALLVMVTLFCLTPVSSYALFTNGGFESGNLDGWTVDFGVRNAGSQTIDWNAANQGTDVALAVTATSGLTENISAYNGNYMAQINDIDGNYDATRISQTDTISQQDIDDGATLFVNWGALLVEPINVHPDGDQPFFGITLTVGGDVTTTMFDALDQNGTVVGYAGGDIWYEMQTWSTDLSAYAIGTPVAIDMFIADCGWGGHGAYALLDGIGTTYVPPDDQAPVPEPATILLLGIGLVAGGGACLRRKKQ